MATEEIQKTLAFDPDKASEALTEIVEVFKKYKLRAGEIAVVYGNLGYTLGASIAGYQGKGPGDVKELERLYYANPTLGIALMLQGMQTTIWYEDHKERVINKDKTPIDIVKARKKV